MESSRELQVEHLCKSYRKKRSVEGCQLYTPKRDLRAVGRKRCGKKYPYADDGYGGFSYKRKYPVWGKDILAWMKDTVA